jgi:DNA-binding transcriptional regulator YhcF (GntR family)
MRLDNDATKPIYLQIAEWLETQILAEKIACDEKVFSQYQLAEMFNVNPATAAKGLSTLADEGILYKKRGLGMFVAPDAKAIIVHRRREKTLRQLILDLVLEAVRLEVSEIELAEMIRKAKAHLKGDGQL